MREVNSRGAVRGTQDSRNAGVVFEHAPLAPGPRGEVVPGPAPLWPHLPYNPDDHASGHAAGYVVRRFRANGCNKASSRAVCWLCVASSSTAAADLGIAEAKLKPRSTTRTHTPTPAPHRWPNGYQSSTQPPLRCHRLMASRARRSALTSPRPSSFPTAGLPLPTTWQ